ncbi:hypothetical protein DC363_16330 [Thalassorhabdomicrobium marinisediminis]|uniref:Uncharacterized protein n=1 Tax=Thalassorhabdomicrobium marinisediminis TaxID=2170577 RepID=A0A2T7FSP6_9RHOB|nr:hypothetical protein DC363_16330 [Thalassorhabdomicrobium marinisediminis]
MSVSSLHPSGVFHSNGQHRQITFSQSAAWTVQDGPRSFFVEWSGDLSVSRLNTSQRSRLGNGGPVVLSFGSAPDGTIDLNSSSGPAGAVATADVSLTDNTGGTGTITSSAFSPPGGAITQQAITTTASGGAFTALTTDGTNALSASYGAIFDAGGFVLSGLGDTQNSEVVIEATDRITSVRQQILGGWQIPTTSDWTITAKVGPTLTVTDRSLSRDEMVEIAPTTNSANGPTIGLTSRDTVTSSTYGAATQISFSRPLTDAWTGSIGLSAEIGRFDSKYSGYSRVTAPSLSDGPEIRHRDRLSGATGRAGLQIGVSRPIALGGVLSLSLYGQRGFNQPTLRATALSPITATVSGTGEDASLVSTGQQAYRNELTTGSSWSAGAGVSVAYVF